MSLPVKTTKQNVPKSSPQILLEKKTSQRKAKSAPALLNKKLPKTQNKETLFDKLPNDLFNNFLEEYLNQEVRNFRAVDKHMKAKIEQIPLLKLNLESINNEDFLIQLNAASYPYIAPSKQPKEIKEIIKKLMEPDKLDIVPGTTLKDKFHQNMVMYDTKIALYVSVLKYYNYFEEIIKTCLFMYKFCFAYTRSSELTHEYKIDVLYRHMRRYLIILREFSLLYLKIIVNRKHTDITELSLILTYLSNWYSSTSSYYNRHHDGAILSIGTHTIDTELMGDCYKIRGRYVGGSTTVLKKEYNKQRIVYYFLKYYCSDPNNTYTHTIAYDNFIGAIYTKNIERDSLKDLLGLSEDLLESIYTSGYYYTDTSWKEPQFLAKSNIKEKIYKKCVEFINNKPKSGFKLDFTEYAKNMKLFITLKK